MRNPLLPAGASVALALAVVGCGYSTPEPKEPDIGGPTYGEALRVMCEVDKLGGISTEDPFEAGRKRTEVIQANVENPDGIYFRTLLSVKGAAEQAAELRKEAKEAGLETCALADDIEKAGAGGIAP